MGAGQYWIDGENLTILDWNLIELNNTEQDKEGQVRIGQDTNPFYHLL